MTKEAFYLACEKNNLYLSEIQKKQLYTYFELLVETNKVMNLTGIVEENEVYEEECRQMMTMMMAECSSEFEKLPCLLDADILRNILYAGVWTKYDKIQKDRKEGKEQKNGK